MVKFEIHVSGHSSMLTKLRDILSSAVLPFSDGKKIDATKIVVEDHKYWLKITGETDDWYKLLAPEESDKFYSLYELSKECELFLEAYFLDAIDAGNYICHKVYRKGELDEEKSDIYIKMSVSDDFFDTCEWEEIKKPIYPITIEKE